MTFIQSLSSKEELELWDRFRSGDHSAFNLLVCNYTRRLFRYGASFNPDSDFIKDCVQDIFLELWKRRAKIGKTASVKSYLFKALRLRIFRNQPKWRSHVTIDDTYFFEVEFALEDNLIKDQDKLEENMKLQRALNSLPKRQKEVLYLRFYENLTHDEICQVMGLNHQSIYNLLHESIQRLRKYWLKEFISLLFFNFSIS